MYLDNEKISRRQMKRLIVFNIFSISGLIIPRIAVTTAARDGLIAIILGLIFALIYIAFIGFISRKMSGNLMKYSKEKSGILVTFIIGIFYIVKYFASLVFCGRLFAEVINKTLLEDTNVRFIILMLILISAYSASKGFEVRARITELLYFIVLIPIALFLLIGLKSVDMANILPLYTEPNTSIIYGGYAIFITFSTLEFMIFSMHFIKDEAVKSKPEHKYNDKQEKTLKIFKNKNLNYILNALVIAGIIDILLYLVTVGILGTNDTKQKLWSTINMIQIVDLPGGFLQRHDALIISIWMLSIFTLTSGFFYYLLMISKQILRLRSQNYMILPYIILLFAACIIPIDTEVYFWYFEKYMMIIGIPGSIILPLLVLIIGKVRDYFQGIKNQKDYKVLKNIVLLMILPTLLMSTACSDMTEIEDRNFIQSIGVDYKDGQISLSLASPDLASYTEQGSSDEDSKEKLLTVITANDFFQIEEKYLNEGNKKIDFSHLEVIIFGRGLLKNKDIYFEFLDYIENRYEISRNTLIFMSESSAYEIIKINSKLDEGIGGYLKQLYRINVINNGREEIKLQNLLLSKNEGNLVAKLPLITIEDDSILVKGAGYIQNGLVAYEVDIKENDYINLARGFGNNSRLFIEDELENVKYVLKIKQIQKTIEFEEKNNKPFMILRIEGEADLEKGLSNNKKGIDIKLECNQYIHDQIVGLIEEISKENKVDFLNLYCHTYGNKKLWLKYRDKGEAFLEDLEYELEVNIGL